MTEYLKLREAASFLRLSPATLYTYVAARKIPFAKIGTKTIFLKNELEAWVNARRVPAIGEGL